jgi:hypothetical protein
MSPVCENFITSVLQKSWGAAFQSLNGLNMFEKLRGLAALDSDDLAELMRMKAASASQVNMPRIDYAAEVAQRRREECTDAFDLRLFRDGQLIWQYPNPDDDPNRDLSVRTDAHTR